MTKPRRGDRTLIKAMNRNLLLNIIRSQGPLSRTQLTEISGLSVGAVSQLTSDLLSENWIVEVGESDYTGGRRQVMLRLNPTAGYVVGLKLMEDRMVCAVTDLETTVLRYAEGPLAANHSPEAVSDAIAGFVREAMDAAGVPVADVRGVGVGLAGVIDCLAGVVHYSPFFHWKDVPLARLLADRLGLPVYLENDVNTLTIAEQLFGSGHDVPNFAVVTVGRGIGLGMILNHQLYQGEHGGVGELGHVTIDPQGPECNCGKQGCLETVANDGAVLRYVRHAVIDGRETRLTLEATIPGVIRAAEAGDAVARQALARSGHYLGLGLAIVVNVLCPSLIIVSGEGVAAGDYRLGPMIETMREHVFNGLLDNVEILVKPADDQTWARGAASLVVGKLFESPLMQAAEPV